MSVFFSVDGIEWGTGCKIERVCTIEESEVSGMLLDHTYLSDPWGTWIEYTVSVVCPREEEAKYHALHEILVAPAPSHRFIMPYNDSTITFDGRIMGKVKDVHHKVNGKTDYWEGCVFTARSNAPVKLPS